MPQPTLTDVHVNRPLTVISVAYLQDPAGFVADRVFPVVPVEFKSDRYYLYNRGDFNRDDMAIRAPSAESAGGGYTLDNTPNYNCDLWALHKDVDDQIRSNSDSVLAPDRDATLFLTNKSRIRRERQWASKYFATGIWTSEKAGQATADGTHVIYWNLANSTPIEDMRAAKTSVQLASGGYKPNVAVFGRQTWDVLLDHPDFIDRVKYGQTAPGPARTNQQIVAQILELDEVMVMDSVYNSAKEGATESNAFIGGKHALLAYRAPRPSLMEPSAGYVFNWTGMLGNVGTAATRIKSFRMENLSSDRIEIETAFDMKQIGAELAYFFNGVVQ